MDSKTIMYRVAECHNRLAQVIANGVDFKSGDNVVLMGEALVGLRMLVQELRNEAGDESAEPSEN